MGVGRNAQCPCGSGMKYKLCCLRRESEVGLDVARAEGVWERMQNWALARFHDELLDSLKEHFDARGIGTSERPVMDDDLSVALCWLLIDRPLADGGGPPAPRYAQLPEISESEGALARRIAESGLGVHRVRDVSPGAWIDLENVLTGARVRVSSPNVSGEAVRWDVLLCRVMASGPTPTLWGGAAFYQPDEEPELLAEIERIATAWGLGKGPAGLEEAMRVGARELVCFIPDGRRVEPMPYTLEGDPAMVAEASWRVRDPDSVLDELSAAPDLVATGETEGGEGLVFQWTASRDDLMARQRELPRGAVCLESRPISVTEDGDLELTDVTSLGSFTLRGGRLDFEGISETRLNAAVALVERRLGGLVSRPTRRVRSFDEYRSSTPSSRARGASHEEPPVSDERFRRLLWRRWIDDPVPRLAGISPRAAAASGRYRDELELLLRGIEHRSACERADGLPGPEVAWLRAELGLDTEPLAM
jgi:hypothetical protein